MIALVDFKALLGDRASNLSEIEVERIRDLEYQIADALFESWLSQRAKTSKTELEKNITNLYNE
jgi:hypothetical protein